VESWVLVSHRGTPKPEDISAGRFALDVVVGGRMWDGDRWNIDVELGHVDRDTFKLSGEMKWTVSKPSGNGPEMDKAAERVTQDAFKLAELGETQVKAFAHSIGLGDRAARQRLEALVAAGRATVDKTRQPHLYRFALNPG
jgi:hypothetical protein